MASATYYRYRNHSREKKMQSGKQISQNAVISSILTKDFMNEWAIRLWNFSKQYVHVDLYSTKTTMVSFCSLASWFSHTKSIIWECWFFDAFFYLENMLKECIVFFWNCAYPANWELWKNSTVYQQKKMIWTKYHYFNSFQINIVDYVICVHCLYEWLANSKWIKWQRDLYEFEHAVVKILICQLRYVDHLVQDNFHKD